MGVPGGPVGVPFEVHGSPWGVLRRSQGVLGEEPKSIEQKKGFSRSVWEGPGPSSGDSGRLGWSLGPAQGVSMLIFPLFEHVFASEVLYMFSL